jgi:hypothetical protein
MNNLLENLIADVQYENGNVMAVPEQEHALRLHKAAMQFATQVEEQNFVTTSAEDRQKNINFFYKLFASGAAWAAMDMLEQRIN